MNFFLKYSHIAVNILTVLLKGVKLILTQYLCLLKHHHTYKQLTKD